MFGIDGAGYAWLVTVDGRQPDASAGMTLVELQRLAQRLGLTDALNLDGGGSTTMVIAGNVVNQPSDPTGARTVSDVLLVVPRRRRGRPGAEVSCPVMTRRDFLAQSSVAAPGSARSLRGAPAWPAQGGVDARCAPSRRRPGRSRST